MISETTVEVRSDFCLGCIGIPHLFNSLRFGMHVAEARVQESY